MLPVRILPVRIRPEYKQALVVVVVGVVRMRVLVPHIEEVDERRLFHYL
jgi:hypothetical protein